MGQCCQELILASVSGFQCFLSLQEFIRSFSQCILLPLPAHELSDLATDRRNHFEQVGVRFPNLTAKKLGNAKYFGSKPDWTGERSLEACFYGDLGSQKTGAFRDLRNPARMPRSPHL